MKNRLFRILPLSISVLGLFFWFLGLVGVEAFSFFTFLYVALFFTGAYSLSFLLRGIFESKEDSILKRTWFIFFGSFLVGFVVCLIFVLPIGEDRTFTTVLAGVLIALGVASILSLLFRGPNKWDKGDNEKEGYMNYRERKALEEQEKMKEQGLSKDV